APVSRRKRRRSRGQGVAGGARRYQRTSAPGLVGRNPSDPERSRRAAMLTNPKEYLGRARREGWALGGFNVYDLESARAVIAAGAQKAPLLVQTSEGAVKHMGLDNAVTIVRALADKSAAPVALHLDHGKSEELARAAVDAGYTSVMIDASRQTFDENMRETAH